jgi:hypothetical protein
MALSIFPDFRFAEKCRFLTTLSIVRQVRKAQHISNIKEGSVGQPLL